MNNSQSRTQTKMLIYNLPIDINRQLCRLLDHDDKWKDLAGYHMKFDPFEIMGIEQTARAKVISPTNQLLTQWGQMNHNANELFILLHKMDQVPAMYCLRSVVDEKYLPLLTRRRNGGQNRPVVPVDVNGNRPGAPCNGSSSLPLPVQLLEQGNQLPSSSHSRVSVPNSEDESSSVGNTSSTHGVGQSRDNGAENDDFIRQHVSAIPLLKYEDLRESTNNWSKSNLLGQGGFGQVYKGEWKLLTVAVKRLANNDGKNRELIREMCLNQYRHDNILPLYGYSLGGPEACLVYQLMAGGSLEQRLRCKTQHPPLSWSQRHRISHGVARGLLFLHTMTGTPLIHGDIKPANILLDQCTIPKIGDFGLARKGPYGEERTHLKVSRVHGTRAYLPDEYLRSRCLSPAVDVFSYGVVLVEIATGLRAILPPPPDRPREPLLLSDHIHQLANDRVDFTTLEDRMISGTQLSNSQLCKEFIEIGIHCTAVSRRERPNMMQVYKKLDAMNFPGRNTN
ncbi:serine/threonine-protein kinase pelle isoform X1 [Hyposmocoma kahamanoa]|uniref:serine/threonine-protein kinase pelle isoform X1 n=1 Tax=Hyposmocoma kahamanoa TaxID=1477025 RepID=UPI000E6D99AE|nr:serine/threonine-protein kinase pelle isoform X1 [Hyposmocoma kahamanoa]